MVEIHTKILPFKKWALVTGSAFVLCILFGITDIVVNLPEEPTTIEEPSESNEEPSE